eukprot:gene12294-2243_t
MDAITDDALVNCFSFIDCSELLNPSLVSRLWSALCLDSVFRIDITSISAERLHHPLRSCPNLSTLSFTSDPTQAVLAAVDDLATGTTRTRIHSLELRVAAGAERVARAFLDPRAGAELVSLTAALPGKGSRAWPAIAELTHANAASLHALSLTSMPGVFAGQCPPLPCLASL